MIYFLQGTIAIKEYPYVIIDVNGVGYEVEISLSTYAQLPELQQTVRLFTHLIIREDAHLLIGFHDLLERNLFRTLIKINGIGSKLALAILSNIEPLTLAQTIEQQNSERLCQIPGIGKKMAARLVIEMRDALKNIYDKLPLQTIVSNVADTQHYVAATSLQPVIKDAVSALMALGYKSMQAEQAVKRVYRAELSCEAVVREALKCMANA